MFRVPHDLDLSKLVGEFATQIHVGQYDLQFTFGEVNIAVQSAVSLIRNGEVIGKWKEGNWPDARFYEIMNMDIVKFDIPNDRSIILHFENGIEMHLMDDSDQYECIQISFKGDPNQWII